MKIFQFIIFYCLASNCLGQNDKMILDSLNLKIIKLKALPHSFQNDTAIIKILNQKSTLETTIYSTDIGMNSAQEAIFLSEKIGWQKGIKNSNYTMAEALHVKSRYFSAIKYFLKVLNLAGNSGDDETYLKCLRQIGGSYMWMDRPKEALKYYQLFAQKAKGKKYRGSYINDGTSEIGELYSRFFNNPKLGLTYLMKAKKGYEIAKDTFGLAYVSAYMGTAYGKLNQPKKAIESFDLAIKYYKIQNSEYLLADAYIYFSEFSLKLGNLDKAQNLAEEAKKIAEKLGILFSIKNSNRLLYSVYKKQGNYQMALKHFELFADSRDSMSEANIDDRLKVIRYEYDTQLQKAEIEKKTHENNRKNNLIFSLIIGLIGLATIAFFAFRYQNIRKKIAEKEVIQLQQEKQLIGTNSVIKGQEEERSRLAKDLHDGLGGILSGVKFTLNSMTGNQVISEQSNTIFNRALGQLDNAISELRRVAHSMMPEALLKFGLQDALQDYCEGINQTGKLKVNFEAWGFDSRLEQSMEVSLYRIVQELLNNTMKHSNATSAHVQLAQDENLLTLTVEDNGKGFDVSDLAKNKGAGITNVESRVAYLNGKMDIKSGPDIGTSIEVQIMI